MSLWFFCFVFVCLVAVKKKSPQTNQTLISEHETCAISLKQVRPPLSLFCAATRTQIGFGVFILRTEKRHRRKHTNILIRQEVLGVVLLLLFGRCDLDHVINTKNRDCGLCGKLNCLHMTKRRFNHTSVQIITNLPFHKIKTITGRTWSGQEQSQKKKVTKQNKTIEQNKTKQLSQTNLTLSNASCSRQPVLCCDTHAV